MPASVSIARPIIILSAPRSGSTLLFETLSRHPELYSLGTESHGLIESNPSLSPPFNNFDSNALTESHATPEITERIRNAFASSIVSYSKERPPSDASVRLLEKTPKNAVRIPFLKKLFPDARFVHLVRDPIKNIASIIDAWQSGRFVTYPFLPGWDAHWSLFLPPGWRTLKGQSLADVAAYQWKVANQSILSNLDYSETGDTVLVRYEDLVAEPQKVLARICDFHKLAPHQFVTSDEALPYSQFTLTPPSADKWLRHQRSLSAVELALSSTVEKINLALAEQALPSLHVTQIS